MVDWPLASVIDPYASLDAMLALLLYATKLSVPLLSVTLGFNAALPLVNRPNVVEPLLGMLMPVLSTVRAPPWPTVTAPVASVPRRFNWSTPAVKAPLTAMPLTV